MEWGPVDHRCVLVRDTEGKERVLFGLNSQMIFLNMVTKQEWVLIADL